MAEHVNMKKLYNKLKKSGHKGIPVTLTAREATKLYGELMALDHMIEILLKARNESQVLTSDYRQTIEALRAENDRLSKALAKHDDCINTNQECVEKQAKNNHESEGQQYDSNCI